MMRITLSGSMAFLERMRHIQETLNAAGSIEVYIPNTEAGAIFNEAEAAGNTQKIIDLQHDVMAEHIERIRDCDGILFVNEAKNDQKGYMGTNTLIELGTALALEKKIFFLYEPDKSLPYYHEAMAAYPIILNGDLSKITELSDEGEVR